MSEDTFEHYFTLDEAAALIPFVKGVIEKAHLELKEQKETLVLYRRLVNSKAEEVTDTNDPDLQSLKDVLSTKWTQFETTFNHWVSQLTEKGIQVKNMEHGLIDFPYKAKDGSEYFLCWHMGEEGVFYFHDLYEGYRGRKPITLLPE